MVKGRGALVVGYGMMFEIMGVEIFLNFGGTGRLQLWVMGMFDQKSK